MNGFKILIPSIFLACSLQAQVAIQLERAAHEDSSYYDVFRLSNGKIWMGGEYGILKQLAGNTLEKIHIPNNGSNILKITQIGDDVFIAADHGTIYRYNLITKQSIRKVFQGFENLCFYDIIPDKDGKLIVCGGNSGIGKGNVRIPKGFIARIDAQLESVPEVIWSNKFQFVWSLCRDEKGNIASAIYNGRNTRIVQISEEGKFETKATVKGLVHSLNLLQNKLMYAGTQSFRYKQNGTWGIVGDPSSHRVIKNAGFISGLVGYNEMVIGYSQQGRVFNLQSNDQSVMLETPSGAVYEAVSDADGILFVGHGKSCFRLNLKDK